MLYIDHVDSCLGVRVLYLRHALWHTSGPEAGSQSGSLLYTHGTCVGRLKSAGKKRREIQMMTKKLCDIWLNSQPVCIAYINLTPL